jgi:hypothetical protein
LENDLEWRYKYPILSYNKTVNLKSMELI